MALRTIVLEGDECLRKVCRPVPELTDRMKTLIDDMLETMYDADGVGLAAPQVGVLRRMFVVDVGEGPVVLVNPEIIESKDPVEGDEGCLSIPGKGGSVVRYNYIKMKGLNREGEEVEYEATEFFARALQHEYDHLDGILYTDKADDVWTYREKSEEEEADD